MDPPDDSGEEVNPEEAEGQEQEDRFVPPILGDPVIYSYDDPDGVPIQFPKTAYPSQELLMNAVIRGVRQGKNCLLESPTGTGKTLALLCPVVAWLQKCREEGQDYWRIPNVEDGPCTCDFDVHEDCRIIQEAGGRTWARMYPRIIRIPLEPPPGSAVEPLEAKEVDKLCTRCRLKYFKRSTPPKMYYTTRTVSQSKGNVRQFLATHYRDSVRMTILTSKDKSIYPNALEGVKGMLSADHFKTFTVRWYKGRVMLFHYGIEKPLISWDGPKELGFTNVGVRTVGASGEWRVQGLPNFTTPDSNEYHDIEINCGRLDYELQSWHDCYLYLFPEMKVGDDVRIIMNGWDLAANGRGRSKWAIGTEVGFAREPKDAWAGLTCENEFRKFWIKWDTTNLYFGQGGSNTPIATVLNYGNGFKTFKYFGLKSINGAHADWHILNSIGKYDVGHVGKEGVVGVVGGGAIGGVDGDANQPGYLVYNYTY